MTILNIAAILCIGLLIGVEFAVSAFINPALGKLETTQKAAALRIFARNFGTVMPFWYAASLLLLLVETLFRRGTPAFAPLAVASGIWAAVIVLTLVFLVPINNRMMRIDPAAFSQEEQREHHKWDTLHRLRVAALALSFALFLSTVVR